jgi:hypothetical protein
MATRTKKLTRAARRAVKQAGKTAAKVVKGIRKEAKRRQLRRKAVRALGATGNILEAAGKAVVVAGAVTAAAADELR